VSTPRPFRPLAWLTVTPLPPLIVFSSLSPSRSQIFLKPSNLVDSPRPLPAPLLMIKPSPLFFFSFADERSLSPFVVLFSSVSFPPKCLRTPLYPPIYNKSWHLLVSGHATFCWVWWKDGMKLRFSLSFARFLDGWRRRWPPCHSSSLFSSPLGFFPPTQGQISRRQKFSPSFLMCLRVISTPPVYAIKENWADPIDYE